MIIYSVLVDPRLLLCRRRRYYYIVGFVICRNNNIRLHDGIRSKYATAIYSIIRVLILEKSAVVLGFGCLVSVKHRRRRRHAHWGRRDSRGYCTANVLNSLLEFLVILLCVMGRVVLSAEGLHTFFT